MPHPIQPLTAAELCARLPQFVALLRDAVEDGASIGFLLPLSDAVATAYWRGVARALNAGTRLLWAAGPPAELLGTVQLDLADKPNARHRAEVQKLLVHTRARRQGLGRELMLTLEAEARAPGTIRRRCTRASDLQRLALSPATP